jgi:hypothetical protein
MSTETLSKEEINAAIDRLVEEYRSMCLWFAPRRYFPASDPERVATLDDIERYGDREAFKRARELKEWLLQASNGM